MLVGQQSLGAEHAPEYLDVFAVVLVRRIVEVLANLTASFLISANLLLVLSFLLRRATAP